jgi:hypothetical protein
VKDVKNVYEKDAANWNMLVSQVIAGGPVNTYYITTLQPSLAAFDTAPNLQKLMGEEAFANWLKAGGEDVLLHEVVLMRIMPELSNAPEDVVKVAPDFWRPKPVAAARPKTKPVETAKASQ